MSIENKTLHEIISIIMDLYCNNQRMPIIHFCVDLDGINSYHSFTITQNDNSGNLISLVDLVETVRTLSDEEKSKIVGYIFIEFKSFLVANRGPVFKTNLGTYQDDRLWVDNFPSQDWLDAGLDFLPDTGDYGFTRYNIAYSGDNYIDSSKSCTISFGPQGIAYGDPENITSAVQDWKNDYSDDDTLVRTYSQRTRVSYRVHIIASTSDVLVLDQCQATVTENKQDEEEPVEPGTTAPPGHITTDDYIIAFCDETSGYCNKDGTSKRSLWLDHVNQWNSDFSHFNVNKIRMFDVEYDPAKDMGNYVYPRHDSSAEPTPIQVDKCPRNNPEMLVDGQSLTGVWLKNKVDEICPNPGSMSSKPHLVIFVDNSGSMKRSSIATGLDEFKNNYGDLYEITEVLCSNEKWLLWFMNAANGDTSICN